MSNYSEARKKANKNWDSKNLDRISIAMPKGSKDVLKAYTEKNGESINSFINRAVMEVMETENIHRAYQRGLLRHLGDIDLELESGNIDKAKLAIRTLIEDTRKDIIE